MCLWIQSLTLSEYIYSFVYGFTWICPYFRLLISLSSDRPVIDSGVKKRCEMRQNEEEMGRVFLSQKSTVEDKIELVWDKKKNRVANFFAKRQSRIRSQRYLQSCYCISSSIRICVHSYFDDGIRVKWMIMTNKSKFYHWYIISVSHRLLLFFVEQGRGFSMKNMSVLRLP